MNDWLIENIPDPTTVFAFIGVFVTGTTLAVLLGWACIWAEESVLGRKP